LSAAAIASEVLKCPKIQDSIARLYEMKDLDANWILSRLMQDVEELRIIEPASRIKALELLGKYVKLWKEDVTNNNTINYTQIAWGSPKDNSEKDGLEAIISNSSKPIEIG
jgi:hypothetical protein